MLKKLVEYYNYLERFFLANSSLYQLGLMRLGLSMALFGNYIWRQLEVDFYYTSTKGFILRNQAIDMLPEIDRSVFPFFIWPDEWAIYVHSLYLLLLVGLILGIGGRVWTFLTWFIGLGFLQRNFSISYGGDFIGTLWLFYLSWTKHNAHFSVLNIINKNRLNKIKNDIFSSAASRLIQIHLCIIYTYTGIHKLKGSSWWEGTALWQVFGNTQCSVYGLSWTAQYPMILSILNFGTLFFEIYFMAMVLNKKTRYLCLFIGCLLHIGIGMTMGIWSFALVMISPYVLFISYEKFEKIEEFILARFHKLG